MLDMALVRQFLSFTAVGAVGTGVHYVVLVLLVAVLGISPVISTSVGAVAGALVNYALNYRLTFASSNGHARALRRFMTVAAGGLLVNAAIVEVGVNIVGAHYLLVQVVATVVVLLLGYAANRAWTFGEDCCASR